MPGYEDPGDESAGLDLRRKALAQLAGGSYDVPTDSGDESQGLDTSAPLPPAASPIPTQPPPPEGLPDFTDANRTGAPTPVAGAQGDDNSIRALAHQSILARLQDSLKGPDSAALVDIFNKANRASQMERIGGWGRRIAASGFTGGLSDPMTYLAQLQGGLKNADEQSMKREQLARQQPVQQFMQLQAQKKLGLEQGRRATEEGTRLLNEERLERQRDQSGAGYSEAEKAPARQRMAAFAGQLGLSPDDPNVASIIATTHPGNVKDNIATLSKYVHDKALGARSEDALQFHIADAERRAGQRDQSLANAGERNRVLAAGVKTREANANLSSERLANDEESGLVPGFALQQRLKSGEAKELKSAHGYTRAVGGLIDEFQAQLKQMGPWDRIPVSTKYQLANQLEEQLAPYMNAAEMKGVFTKAHDANIRRQLSDWKSIFNFVNDQRFPAVLEATKNHVRQALDERMQGSGATRIPGYNYTGEAPPGQVKTARPGQPGAPGYKHAAQPFAQPSNQGGTVGFRTPNGKAYDIPADMVDSFLASPQGKGAVRE